jgi:uncharacterized protein YgiB involved in biofilm formation
MLYGSRTTLVLTYLAALLAGCAASNEQCMRDNEQCVRRCQNAGTPDHSKETNPRYVSETTCEQQCGCGKHKPAPPAASGPPTFTGN